MLEIGDSVSICIKRWAGMKTWSEIKFGIITDFIDATMIEISIEISGRQEYVELLKDSLLKSNSTCSNCVHRLEKLVTNNCPGIYERREIFKNEMDRNCGSSILDDDICRMPNS